MLQHLDHVVAIFNPLRLDDLKPSLLPMVGEVGVWYAAWMTEDDATNCPGEWAMSPHRWPQWEQRRLRGDFCWVPLSDLSVLEVLEGISPNVFDAARRVRFWRKQKAAEVAAVRQRVANRPRSIDDLKRDERGKIVTQPIKAGTAVLITRLKGGPLELHWHEQPGGTEAINALWDMYPPSLGWSTSQMMTWARTLGEKTKRDIEKWAADRYGVELVVEGPPVVVPTKEGT